MRRAPRGLISRLHLVLARPSARGAVAEAARGAAAAETVGEVLAQLRTRGGRRGRIRRGLSGHPSPVCGPGAAGRGCREPCIDTKERRAGEELQGGWTPYSWPALPTHTWDKARERREGLHG